MLLVTSALEIYLNLESRYNSGEGRTLENCSCLKFLLNMSVCVCVCVCVCVFVSEMDEKHRNLSGFPHFPVSLCSFFFFYQFFLVAKHMSKISVLTI